MIHRKTVRKTSPYREKIKAGIQIRSAYLSVTRMGCERGR